MENGCFFLYDNKAHLLAFRQKADDILFDIQEARPEMLRLQEWYKDQAAVSPSPISRTTPYVWA